MRRDTIRPMSFFDWPESLIATHSGLRGRPGVDLTPRVVMRVIGAFVSMLRESGAAASLGVARDERPAGRALAADVIRLGSELGLDVVDFGAISTPTTKLAARLRDLGGAAIVTASHLGPEWNGLKLIAAPHYAPIDIRRLLQHAEAAPQTAGRVSRDGRAASDHADVLCGSVDVALIRSASLRVSSTGGVGSLAKVVLSRLGCRRPIRERDIGLRLDADGDRLQLVDERGDTLEDEVVLPLTAIARDARRVVKGADTSRMIDELAAARGGWVAQVAPGELHLVEGLMRTGAELAGEGNGGVIVPAVGLARDGLAAAVAILELLARTRRPLSQLVADLPRRIRRRSTVPCGGAEEALEALCRLAAVMGVESPDDPENGVSIETAGGSWGLARQSATEPVLRVTVEAHDADAANALHRELLAALSAHPLPV
jgi:phosphomannomutase